MSVGMKTFQTYAVHTCNDVKDSNRRSLNAWIVSAVFNSLHFINDPRYLGGDGTVHIL